jgi:hypothetical protein
VHEVLFNDLFTHVMDRIFFLDWLWSIRPDINVVLVRPPERYAAPVGTSG